jgi:hypothetical protein
MTILGWILIVIGSFWCLGRIQNQGQLYRFFLNVSSEKGFFFAIQRTLSFEILLGFGMGTFLLSLGYFFIYDSIPLKLIFGLLTWLFYVFACKVSYINITEGITPRTRITPIERTNPMLSSIIPLGHPIFLVILYMFLATLTFYI